MKEGKRMKKKILITLISICTMLLTSGIVNASEEVQGSFYFSIQDGEAILGHCNTNATIAEIPSEYSGCPVTTIGAYAFESCTKLRSISIPDTVTSIGTSAFTGCKSIPEIKIPDSVTKIGSLAFENCSGLTDITIPASVTSIGTQAFKGCKGLTSVTIPDTVLSIGDAPFDSCTSLTQININDSNENFSSVNGHLFNKDKTTLIQYALGKSDTSFTVPDSVTKIATNAFAGSTNLKNITLPASVKEIGFSAFNYCSNLESINLPDAVTSIADSVFAYCFNLKNLSLGDEITNVGANAFYCCSSLSDIKLPNVESIGEWTFTNCSGLKSITLGTNLTNVSFGAFDCCELTDVYYSGSEDDWNKIEISTDWNYSLSSATKHYNTVISATPKLTYAAKKTNTSLTVNTSDFQDVSASEVILAVYDEVGALKELKSLPLQNEVTFTNVDLSKGSAKVMAWDTFSEMFPFAKVLGLTLK